MVGQLFVVVALLGAAPNDPLFLGDATADQWNLMGTVHPEFPDAGVRGIDAEGAWSITRGRPDVVLAVIDSGVWMQHEDLAANIDLNLVEAEAMGIVDVDGDGVLLLSEAALVVGDLDGDLRVTPVDVRLFAENGVDDDANGYVDDLTGWDFEEDDNDPTDIYGHGTGRAGIAAAVTDNGIGMAGVCPGCRILPVRIGRTFVATTDKIAEAIAYAADRGATATIMANASLGNSATLRAAVDYADARGVVQCAAIGNENSRHHHFPQSYEAVIAVTGVAPGDRAAPEDWSARAGFSNFGAHADLAAPTFTYATHIDDGYGVEGGTSSSVPHCAGVAGLVVSRARDLGVMVSPRQVAAILASTADGAPGDWSADRGTGRLNARTAVEAVGAGVGALPPDARIVSPRWYAVLPVGEIAVEVAVVGTAGDAVVLEYGYGVDPIEWLPAQPGSPWNFAAAPPAPGDPLLDRLGDSYAVTVRLTVGESVDRRTFFVRTDPDALAGWPLDLGSSAEGSPLLVDLDGDNRLEVILGTSEGRVHARRVDGSAVAGWPVSLDPSPVTHPSAPAHLSGAVPACCATVFAGVAAGDLDGDGAPEIVAGGIDGKVYAWRASGARLAGWPRDLGSAIWAAPVLADLDGDGSPEIVVATTESESASFPTLGRVYVFEADGSPRPGFPVKPFGLMPETFPIVGSGVPGAPALADLDGDGRLEVIAGHAAGQIAAFDADGVLVTAFDHGSFIDGVSPHGPGSDGAHPRFEMNLLLLAQPVAADLDNDGEPEVMAGTMGLPIVDVGALAADPGAALARLESVLTVWDAKGVVRDPFPRDLEGWTLLASTTVADLDSDTLPEILLGTDGGWIHALNARGEEAPGFPRFAGGWLGTVASVGDLDGDGDLDLVAATREGNVFAWRTGGAACVNGKSAATFPAFHHDIRNTGDPRADAIPPGAVADARVEDGRLVFTAVGDDGFAGAASRYEARWSTTAITTRAQFDAATPIEVGRAPLAGTLVRAGGGIPAGAFVAVLARDDAENVSALPASGAAIAPAACIDAPVIRLDGGGSSPSCACRVSTARPSLASMLLSLGFGLGLGFRRIRTRTRIRPTGKSHS